MAAHFGRFLLIAIDGPQGRRPVGDGESAKLLDVLAGAIADAAERPGAKPSAWVISTGEAVMQSAQRAIFAPPGEPEPGICRTAAVPGSLIAEIAGAFERPENPPVAARKPANATSAAA
jgi:hypothetical protein